MIGWRSLACAKTKVWLSCCSDFKSCPVTAVSPGSALNISFWKWQGEALCSLSVVLHLGIQSFIQDYITPPRHRRSKWSAGIEWLDPWLFTLWAGCGGGVGGWESRAGTESQSLRRGGGCPACRETVQKKKERQGWYYLLLKMILKSWWCGFRLVDTSAAGGPYEPLGNQKCRDRLPQPAGWPPSAHPRPWGSHSPAPALL